MKKNLGIFFIVFLSISIGTGNAQETLNIEIGTASIKDAYINIVNNFSNGDSEGLVAAVWTYSGEFGMGRSLIGFDLSELGEDIIVVDARLNLYHNPTTSHIGHSTIGGDNSGMIFRITEQWDEHQVNWINQPSTTNTHAIYIPAPPNDTADFLNVDITPIIQDMIRHPETSDGFMIKLFNEDTLYRSLSFASSDYPFDSLHPTILITYYVNPLLASYYTICPDQENGKDVYINSFESISKENDQSLVSSVWEYDQGWGIGRSFLEFDLSHIDSEQTVTLAELSLFHDSGSSIEGHINNGSSNELVVSRITESWHEDYVSWDNQPTFSTVNQVIVESSNISNQDYLDIDVTDLVTDMLSQSNEPFGFMIQLFEEEIGNYNRNVVFASSDNEFPELRPQLKIYTKSSSGIEKPIIDESMIYVYPNPGKGEFNIQILKNKSSFQYRLTDSFGKIILSAESMNSEFDINITSLSSGIYILYISINNSVITKKIIKL